MKLRRTLLAASLVIVFIASPVPRAGAYKFEFTTVSDVVKKIRQRFGEVESYQASFRIVSDKAGKKSQQSGMVRYKSPDRMLVEFDQPPGQKIITTGSTMWVYIPSMNVVAEQDLKSQSESIFGTGSRSGLPRLLTKYQ